MRAVAHPLRVRLLELMTRDGEVTATRAAEVLGESPGNMSWHLQTLAKYGFVTETGQGRGRSRPWRLVNSSHRFDANEGDTAAAGEALQRAFLERVLEQLREWWSSRLGYSMKWRRAAFMSDSVSYLTSEELDQLSEEIVELFSRFVDRLDKSKRPPGALPVHLYAHGHPLPPTADGN